MSARQRDFSLIGDNGRRRRRRLGTNRGAWGRVGYQRCAIRRIRGGFLRDMGASLPSRLRTAGSGSRPGLEQVPCANGRAKGLDPPAKGALMAQIAIRSLEP